MPYSDPSSSREPGEANANAGTTLRMGHLGALRAGMKLKHLIERQVFPRLERFHASKAAAWRLIDDCVLQGFICDSSAFGADKVRLTAVVLSLASSFSGWSLNYSTHVFPETGGWVHERWIEEMGQSAFERLLIEKCNAVEQGYFARSDSAKKFLAFQRTFRGWRMDAPGLFDRACVQAHIGQNARALACCRSVEALIGPREHPMMTELYVVPARQLAQAIQSSREATQQLLLNWRLERCIKLRLTAPR